MDFLADKWQWIVGTLVVVFGGLWVPGLRTLVMIALKTLVSEAVLKRIFLEIAGKLVKSTKTQIDDIWLEELKKRL